MSHHVHSIPVPQGMSAAQAWDEITTLGSLVAPGRITGWASVECDQVQCQGIDRLPWWKRALDRVVTPVLDRTRRWEQQRESRRST